MKMLNLLKHLFLKVFNLANLPFTCFRQVLHATRKRENFINTLRLTGARPPFKQTTKLSVSYLKEMLLFYLIGIFIKNQTFFGLFIVISV